jgi:hypothetical protein
MSQAPAAPEPYRRPAASGLLARFARSIVVPDQFENLNFLYF